VLEAVGTFLRGRDHRVQTAKDTREARELLEKEEFDIVVADLQVCNAPNGDSLGEWLTQQKPALARRVIWMSAAVRSRSEGDKMAGSGSPILQKPFKASDLLAAVDELLQSSVNVASVER